MPDMLVKLYELPPMYPFLEQQEAAGIVIRRGLAPEKHVVADWIGQYFGLLWRSECEVAFARQPISCFVATEGEKLIGFACYDATMRGFFGPTGVSEVARGRGAGRALFMACLHDMWAQGYGYAIIGAAGPTAFYKKAVSAIEIPDSWPGVYRGLLNSENQ